MFVILTARNVVNVTRSWPDSFRYHCTEATTRSTGTTASELLSAVCCATSCTCGMMLRSRASLYSGAGGRSMLRTRKGTCSTRSAASGRPAASTALPASPWNIMGRQALELWNCDAGGLRGLQWRRTRRPCILSMSSTPVPASVVICSSPCRQRVMMDAFFRLPPVRPKCSVLSSQVKNSTGSLCFSMVNCLALADMTACMNSCGLTCAAAR